jgi:hypothetical protein
MIRKITLGLGSEPEETRPFWNESIARGGIPKRTGGLLKRGMNRRMTPRREGSVAKGEGNGFERAPGRLARVPLDAASRPGSTLRVSLLSLLALAFPVSGCLLTPSSPPFTSGYDGCSGALIFASFILGLILVSVWTPAIRLPRPPKKPERDKHEQ